MNRPVRIIGGGLAGLTLGIGLRKRGVPVTIWEAGHYPRHRVCGEFINGKGQAVLERLGLRSKLEAAGAYCAHTVQFICGSNQSPVRRLPEPALCLSRFTLDALLAELFRELGGELLENKRWTQSEPGEGMVRAAGRRAQPTENGWRWFGLKAHADASSGIQPAADLEMHVATDCYVGVNRIDHGDLNICGLFRARPGDASAESKLHWIRGRPGSTLHGRLGKAGFVPGSFCSVAGLSLEPQRAAALPGCCIGDALTMTPPVTGNGMSMAFESAEIAMEPLNDYSRGRIHWNEAQGSIARACDKAFSNRLAWAKRLQRLMFSPLLRGRAGGILLRSDWLWSLMFERTR